MSRPPRETHQSITPLLWCLLAAALFGASTPASKPLLNTLTPWLLSSALYLGAAIAVAPWALRNIPTQRAIDRRNLTHLLGAVIFGGVIGPVLLLAGLQHTSAASVSLWLSLETVATALLARCFFKEHLGPRAWFAILLVVVASVRLSPLTPGRASGIVLVSLACLAWGLDNNFTAVIDRFTPAQVTFAKGLGAGITNLLVGLYWSSATLDLKSFGWGTVVGSLGYGASLILYITGAQQLGATRSQLAFSTAPAWGLLFSWWFLGEAITPAHMLATTMMAAAIWIWHRERHAHVHRHEQQTHQHWHRHDDGHHQHDHSSPVSPGTWHCHEHTHESIEHAHPHRPDIHHRHGH